MQFSDLRIRVITATLIISGLIGLEILYQAVPVARFIYPVVAVLLVAGCSIEFVALCKRSDLRGADLYHLVPLVSLLVFFASSWIRIQPTSTPISTAALGAGAVGSITALGLIAATGRRSLEEVRIVSAEIFLGALLLSYGGTALVSLSMLPTHALLYWIVAVVICNDTGAYFAGKLFGKHKLSISISPGKTIEGSLGGLFTGMIVGTVLLFLTPFSFLQTVSLTVFLGVTSQLFDLAKSFVKRIYGAKDSGKLLPGHGGLLDRLDGILGGAAALHIFIVLLYG